jgi:hypothetical protein
VRVFVAQLRRVVLFQAETQVELAVEPDFGGVVVLNQDPLPDVEFAAIYNKRVFDVFLDDVLRFLAE